MMDPTGIALAVHEIRRWKRYVHEANAGQRLLSYHDRVILRAAIRARERWLLRVSQ